MNIIIGKEENTLAKVTEEEKKEVSKNLKKHAQRKVTIFISPSESSSSFTHNYSQENAFALCGSYVSNDFKNADNVLHLKNIFSSVESKNQFSYKTRNNSLQDFYSCIFTRPPPISLA